MADRCKDHLFGQPLALSSEEYAKKVWMIFDEIPALKARGISLAQDAIADIDFKNKIATIQQAFRPRLIVKKHYFVAWIGLRRAWPCAPRSMTKNEFLFEAEEYTNVAQNASHGVVVGRK